ncbi:hypothetical protein SGO26_29545 (plasmid) [Cupriavidus metallidurans]
MGRSIWAEIEHTLLAMIEATVTEVQLERANSVLFAQHGTSGMIVLDWLKTPPARHSPSTITETLEKIRLLKELGAHTWALDSVPIEKQRAYGQRLQARRPVKMRDMKGPMRTIELVFFLHITLLELTDSLLYQMGRRVSDLVRQAYNRTAAKQVPFLCLPPQGLIVESDHSSLGDICWSMVGRLQRCEEVAFNALVDLSNALFATREISIQRLGKAEIPFTDPDSMSE